MEPEPVDVGATFKRGGKVWKVAARVGQYGVLAYEEKKAAESHAAPVCFLDPVNKGDVYQYQREKHLKGRKR